MRLGVPLSPSLVGKTPHPRGWFTAPARYRASRVDNDHATFVVSGMRGVGEAVTRLEKIEMRLVDSYVDEDGERDIYRLPK